MSKFLFLSYKVHKLLFHEKNNAFYKLKILDITISFSLLKYMSFINSNVVINCEHSATICNLQIKFSS